MRRAYYCQLLPNRQQLNYDLCHQVLLIFHPYAHIEHEYLLSHEIFLAYPSRKHGEAALFPTKSN